MTRSGAGGWSELALYVVVAYAVTWAVMVPIATGALSERWHFAGALGPGLAAMVVVWRKDGVGPFLRRVLRPSGTRVSWILAGSPLILGAVVAGGLAVGGRSPGNGFGGFVVGVLPLVTYAIFEELGWRGWALPWFQARWAPLASTALLTMVWGVWHLPMFFYRFDFGNRWLIPGFFFTLFFGAVLLTAVTNAAGGSIVGAIMFHLGNNLVSGAANDTFLSVYSTLVILLAIAVMLWTRTRLMDQLSGAGSGFHRRSP